jgi:hypothetical protein
LMELFRPKFGSFLNMDLLIIIFMIKLFFILSDKLWVVV